MKKAKLDKVLKTLMKSRGLKASDLSKSTGIPAATLSSLLNGGQTQKPEHLLALSQFFGISIEFLLFGEDTQKPTLDDVFTEGIFEGWLKVKIERAIPNKKKVKIDD
ncbi:MAG: helix-turn-helix transcriptional regulator [Bdellovibrio sp.]|nr:helix-turn-helix transcriptional regulator [Bdellovibrio sp.]